jgi:hypothetical protein
VVDGEFAGLGAAVVEFAAPGDATVAVTLQGYAGVERVVAVEAGGDAALEVVLEQVEQEMVRLTSSPLLADVYVGSRMAGRTPLELPRPAGLERVELRRDGYEPLSTHIGPSGPAELGLALRPRTIDPDRRQTAARAAFYRAAGIWVVSLPLPFFTWALSLDEAAAFLAAQRAGDATAQLAMLVRYRRLYAGYLGGMFVNLSLLGNMVIELVRYMRAADRPAG